MEGKGNKIGSVKNLDHFSFLIDESVENATDCLLEMENRADLRGGVIEINVKGETLKAAGDTFKLVEATGSDLRADQTEAKGRQGISIEYDYELANDGNIMTATVKSFNISEQTKAVSESRMAGAALINQGMDLASEAGMANAKASMKGNGDVAVFGAIGGGSSKYDTGSSVKVDGVSLMAGAGRNFKTANGDLLGGVFFEAGYGDINTSNSFSTGNVKGSGDSKYYGAGLMARYDVTTSALAGTYLEGSLHIGRVKTNWDTSDMVGSDGKVNNDTSNMYYGAHAGIGYVWNLTKQANLDVYGKYYWSHQGSDSTSVGGQRYDFDSTDSQRTRLGGRLNLNLTESVRPYLGAAWEHEFDGEANAQVYGFDVAAPTLKGDSGIFELGFSFKPAKSDNISFDLGVQAYTGVREGVAGTAQFRYKF